MFFDGSTFISDYVVGIMGGPDAVKAYGFLPLVDVIPDRQLALEGLLEESLTLSEYAYRRIYTKHFYSIGTLKGNLSAHKVAAATKFVVAFGEIDYRCSRATQDIIARNTEITAIDESLTKVAGGAAEELSLLREELLKSNVSDGRVLVETRQIAEVNREMQTELLALEITEDMTLEQAQEITLRIANAQPWLPWRE